MLGLTLSARVAPPTAINLRVMTAARMEVAAPDVAGSSEPLVMSVRVPCDVNGERETLIAEAGATPRAAAAAFCAAHDLHESLIDALEESIVARVAAAAAAAAYAAEQAIEEEFGLADGLEIQ